MTSKDVLSDCLPSDTSTGISSLVNLNNYEDKKSTFKTFSGLKCYHVNVHSLLLKLDEIRYIVSDLKIQCLSVNESFLSPDIGDHEISIDNFCVFRKDRNRHGGGVILYVSKDLSPVAVDIQSEIETIWATIKYCKHKFIVGTLYRPPNSSTDYYESILTILDNIHSYALDIILMGDLNLDNFKTGDHMKINRAVI